VACCAFEVEEAARPRTSAAGIGGEAVVPGDIAGVAPGVLVDSQLFGVAPRDKTGVDISSSSEG